MHYLCSIRFKQCTYLTESDGSLTIKSLYKMTYFVSYNGKYIASRKSLKSAVDFIDAKGIHDDEDNLLEIVDQQGNYYTPDGEPKDI